jgi:hypothetical protein
MIRQYPAPRLAFSGACRDDKLARYGSHVGNTSAVLKAPCPQDAERKNKPAFKPQIISERFQNIWVTQILTCAKLQTHGS